MSAHWSGQAKHPPSRGGGGGGSIVFHAKPNGLATTEKTRAAFQGRGLFFLSQRGASNHRAFVLTAARRLFFSQRHPRRTETGPITPSTQQWCCLFGRADAGGCSVVHARCGTSTARSQSPFVSCGANDLSRQLRRDQCKTVAASLFGRSSKKQRLAGDRGSSSRKAQTGRQRKKKAAHRTTPNTHLPLLCPNQQQTSK